MNIYCHNQLFVNNSATTEYYQIITQAQQAQRVRRKRSDPLFVYYESHHVLPKAIFPEFINSKWNKVLLTAKEHLRCHQLLVEMIDVENKKPYYQMVRAYWSMSTRKTKDMERVKLTPEEYEALRIKFSESQVLLGQKPCKPTTRDKIGKANKGLKPSALAVANSVKARTGKKRPVSAVKASADAQRGNTNVRGKTWWNNGIIGKMSFTCPGPGYVKGRIEFSKEHCANIGKAQVGNTKKRDWAAKKKAAGGEG